MYTPCPRPRLKRTGHPQDRKIRDFAEIISAFLATPSPLIRQNLRFRRNFVKHFSIPWNSDKFSSKSARKHVKLIQNSQKMMKFGGKNCKNKNEKLTNIWVWSGAKEWESCRSRKMWKNAPTLASWDGHSEVRMYIESCIRPFFLFGAWKFSSFHTLWLV